MPLASPSDRGAQRTSPDTAPSAIRGAKGCHNEAASALPIISGGASSCRRFAFPCSYRYLCYVMLTAKADIQAVNAEKYGPEVPGCA
jgi:hypothetical protein